MTIHTINEVLSVLRAAGYEVSVKRTDWSQTKYWQVRQYLRPGDRFKSVSTGEEFMALDIMETPPTTPMRHWKVWNFTKNCSQPCPGGNMDVQVVSLVDDTYFSPHTSSRYSAEVLSTRASIRAHCQLRTTA